MKNLTLFAVSAFVLLLLSAVPEAQAATYTITPSTNINGTINLSNAPTGGTINPSQAVSVNAGGSQAFTITAAAGNQVNQIFVDGSAVSIDANANISHQVYWTVNRTIVPGDQGRTPQYPGIISCIYTFNNVEASHTIAINFAETFQVALTQFPALLILPTQ